MKEKIWVEVGKRIIEEEGGRLEKDGEENGEEMEMEKGEMEGIEIKKMIDIKKIWGIGDEELDILFRCFEVFKEIGEVLEKSNMRIKRIIMEKNGDIELGGLKIIEKEIEDGNGEGSDDLEERDNEKKSGIEKERREKKKKELKIRDIKRKEFDELDIEEIDIEEVIKKDFDN